MNFSDIEITKFPAGSDLGDWGWHEVLQRLVHEYEGPMVVLQSGEEQVFATPNHPVCIDHGDALLSRSIPVDIGYDSPNCGTSGRWVEAGDVHDGDVGFAAGDAIAFKTSVEGGQSRLVYNLTVDGAHSYVVGKSGLLVHNKSASSGIRILQRGGNTFSKSAARALNEAFDLNLHSREWGVALEQLKEAEDLANDFHGLIMSDGSYADTAGKIIGNILEYIP